MQITRPNPAHSEIVTGPDDRLRRRDGFALTDRALHAARGAERDSLLRAVPRARQGHLLEGHPGQGRARSPRTPLGIKLPGCPLDEKISEMHTVRKRGDAIGALAIVTVDNPMCPGTGHRICNDCMKACIYQKQEPVNIPQVETGVLTDVLKLPFGVEIYGLLTRWNPLNVTPAVRAALQRPERAGRRPGPRGLHAVALPAERGLRRRGHRRPEDRAARRRHRGARTGMRRGPSAGGARSTARSTSACSKASAACPSTASPSGGTRTSSR